MSNVVCTPHLGASTSEAQVQVALDVSERVLSLLGSGDTTGAIRAYGHYLTLRDDPDPELVPQWERVRTHLAELLEGSGKR